MTELRVARISRIADRVVELVLVDEHDKPLPEWRPGAHIDVGFANGVVRQYSLCGDPLDERSYRIAVLREVEGRGGSAYVHEVLQQGEAVTVSEPRNHFALAEADSYLFIAGGIGITPLLPMIGEVDAKGREWALLYGGRTRGSMAFTDELAGYGSRVTIAPADETGLLYLPGFLGEPRPDTLIYCCGPEPLLTAAEQNCAQWPPNTLRVERFAPRSDTGPSPDEQKTFEVECRKSGVTVTVRPGESILDTVRAAGVHADSTCEQGTCGTCETVVLDGIPEHNDEVLDDEEKAENSCMMICVGRALSDRLVLDI